MRTEPFTMQRAGVELTAGTIAIAPGVTEDVRWHVTAGQRGVAAEHLRAGRAVTWLGVHLVRLGDSEAVVAEWGLFHVAGVGALALDVRGDIVPHGCAAHLAALRACAALHLDGHPPRPGRRSMA